MLPRGKFDRASWWTGREISPFTLLEHVSGSAQSFSFLTGASTSMTESCPSLEAGHQSLLFFCVQ